MPDGGRELPSVLEEATVIRVIVSVATGHYEPMLDRLVSKLEGETVMSYRRADPPHHLAPYVFKATAIERARTMGFTTVLWCDSSIVPIRPLAPLWEKIEQEGYWFSENLPYGRLDLPVWNCGQWTSDAALPVLGLTREEAFAIPQVIATSFGLCFEHEIAREFFRQFKAFADDRRAFQGPWRNDNHEASADDRVRGHRHDQTVASVIAYRLGMKLTTPPKWIVDGIPSTDVTVMEIHR